MELTYQDFGLKPLPDQLVIALAGNPNTGKSTVFNALTGLKQHTGNWPGKTVLRAEGSFVHRNKKILLVDLPGTYSLLATSADEQVARDFICLGRPSAIVVVTDATCLERNLNLVLQVMEISSKVVVCVNLMDEAMRRRIRVDVDRLSRELGVPCIPTTARDGIGLDKLKDAILDVATGVTATSPRHVTYEPHIEQAAAQLEARISSFLPEWINHYWVALRLLEGDSSIIKAICSHLEDDYERDVLKEGAAAWAR
jgi:Fe2+ transport system protein B